MLNKRVDASLRNSRWKTSSNFVISFFGMDVWHFQSHPPSAINATCYWNQTYTQCLVISLLPIPKEIFLQKLHRERKLSLICIVVVVVVVIVVICCWGRCCFRIVLSIAMLIPFAYLHQINKIREYCPISWGFGLS